MPNRYEGIETPRFGFDIRMLVLSDAAELTRIPVAVLGTWHKGKQKFSITKADVAEMRDNFRKRGNGEIVIDYDHGTVDPSGTGDALASGWLREVEDEADANGIWWGRAEFNDGARAKIAAKEYRYLSPFIMWGYRDKTDGTDQGTTLMSLALTNTPFLDKLPAIALSEGWVDAGAATPAPTEVETPANGGKEKTMAKKSTIKLAEGGKQMVCCCGECGKETMADLPESIQMSEGAGDKRTVITLSEIAAGADGLRDFSRLPKEGALIASEVIAAELAQRDAVDAVDAAVKAGKVLPAQRAAFLRVALSDLPTFTEMMAGAKAQVQLGERGIAGTGEESASIARAKAQEKANGMAAQLVKDRSIDFASAMKVVLTENSDLARTLLADNG